MNWKTNISAGCECECVLWGRLNKNYMCKTNFMLFFKLFMLHCNVFMLPRWGWKWGRVRICWHIWFHVLWLVWCHIYEVFMMHGCLLFALWRNLQQCTLSRNSKWIFSSHSKEYVPSHPQPVSKGIKRTFVEQHLNHLSLSPFLAQENDYVNHTRVESRVLGRWSLRTSLAVAIHLYPCFVT